VSVQADPADDFFNCTGLVGEVDAPDVLSSGPKRRFVGRRASTVRELLSTWEARMVPEEGAGRIAGAELAPAAPSASLTGYGCAR
jgi:hypothetical protein